MDFFMSEFLIYSRKHSKNSHGAEAIWWGWNSSGYTSNIKSAGRYSEHEAKRIAKNSNGDSVAIELEAVQVMPSATKIDRNTVSYFLSMRSKFRRQLNQIITAKGENAR